MRGKIYAKRAVKTTISVVEPAPTNGNPQNRIAGSESAAQTNQAPGISRALRALWTTRSALRFRGGGHQDQAGRGAFWTFVILSVKPTQAMKIGGRAAGVIW
jgi:hypothetical protein